MESEIQFFMTEKDQAVFFEYAKTLLDAIRHPGQGLSTFHVGNCEMTFMPSRLDHKTLYAGKLRMNTIDTDGYPCDKEEKAKKIYRQLKKWIKKNYWSRLAFLDKNKQNKLTPSRAYFLGPDAKKWKDRDPGKHKLKLSATSWMVFEIGI